jgi:antitoxin component of RelBE/YafQ-DinJ toxin-antitoxin module
MPTPLRNVRISDELWEAAKAAADVLGTTVSAEIAAGLRDLVQRAGVQLPAAHVDGEQPLF